MASWYIETPWNSPAAYQIVIPQFQIALSESNSVILLVLRNVSQQIVCSPFPISTHFSIPYVYYYYSSDAMTIPEICLGAALVVIYFLGLIILVFRRSIASYRDGIWILFVAGELCH